jgi:hypothetical protein
MPWGAARHKCSDDARAPYQAGLMGAFDAAFGIHRDSLQPQDGDALVGRAQVRVAAQLRHRLQ